MNDPFDGSRRRDLYSTMWSRDDFAPPSALVRAEIGARTHRGRARQENEDHHLVIRFGRHQETLFTSLSMRDVTRRFDEFAYAAVVADGIGGGGSGALAARVAVSTLLQLARRFGKWQMRIDPHAAGEIMERSEWLYRRTHEAVLTRRRAHEELSRIATTLTAFHSVGPDLFVTHVGHSRCYLLRRGDLTQLTSDHTLREHFATSQQPASVGQAMDDLKHILTDLIGARSTPEVSIEHFQLEDDDCLLLCTNGLTDMVDDEVIADVLGSTRAPNEQCEHLVDLALANGGEDNVTVVVAHYEIPNAEPAA